MNGEELNKKLERGVFGSSIKKLAGAWSTLEAPSDMTCANGVNDSVTQQQRRVDAVWDSKHNKLTISNTPAGPGLWIPYLGNGMPNPVGVAVTRLRGLGTYTDIIGAGVSWVATGPFTGCYAVTFTPPGGKVFAHIITPAREYTADTPANQATNIANQVGAPTPNLAGSQVKGGYVFWTRIKGLWWRRVIHTAAAAGAMSQTVIFVEKRSVC